MKINIAMVAVLLVSTGAFAQSKKRPVTSSAPAAQESSYSYSGGSSSMILSPVFGFYGGTPTVVGTANGTTQSHSQNLSGMFGLGADFEMMSKEDFSWGGFFRYYSTSDSIGSTEYKVSLMTLGPLVRGYMNFDSWLVHFGTGAGIAMMTSKVGSQDISADMSFGVMLSWGAFYKLSSGLHIGVENMKMMGLGEKLNGWILNDFMLKARFAL